MRLKRPLSAHSNCVVPVVAEGIERWTHTSATRARNQASAVPESPLITFLEQWQQFHAAVHIPTICTSCGAMTSAAFYRSSSLGELLLFCRLIMLAISTAVGGILADRMDGTWLRLRRSVKGFCRHRQFGSHCNCGREGFTHQHPLPPLHKLRTLNSRSQLLVQLAIDSSELPILSVCFTKAIRCRFPSQFKGEPAALDVVQ